MKYILTIIVLLLLIAITYRLRVWNVQPQDRQAFTQECTNYGTEKFCNCFLDDLNQKLPAKAIEQLGTNYQKTGAIAQIEKDSVKACLKYNK